MTPERYHQVNQLFHEALERAGEDRADFLKGACGDDEALRLAVERMLAAREQAGSFLNSPAFDAVADSLIQKHSGSLIGCVIGHYRILSKLGEGGMGEVLLAHDTRLERRVALKLLPAEFTSDRDRVRRFEREARAASALNHPNIITIYEIGQAKIESGDLHFIAQEFIEGQTLRRRIEQGALSPLDALDLAIQAAGALQAAHAASIVHRDIKPENIMLRPDGFIKILDFGLAKLLAPVPAQSGFEVEKSTLEPGRTAPGMILGTVAYMSPEQARGIEVDARSDIWSLGVVLYETLTGQKPFKGETFADVIVSIIEREPPPLSRSISKTLPELERIVMRALAKNRDERYQTIKELAIDLKNLKQRLQIDAELERSLQPEETNEPPGARLRTERLIAGKTVKRNRASGVSPSSPRALLITAIILVGAVIGFFVWSRPKSSTPPATQTPERRISYSLTVQKMRDGREYQEPFESTGQEIFESGWKFRLNFNSPQPGYFYLLNEGPTSEGAIRYTLLFPSPSINNGSAQTPANQQIQTGWYIMGEHEGTERLWLVWAAQAVRELEAVKRVVNPRDKGVISSAAELNEVRELLNNHAQSKPEVKIDKLGRRTELTSHGDLLLHLFELEHR
jgi:serine/threonine protein kinase